MGSLIYVVFGFAAVIYILHIIPAVSGQGESTLTFTIYTKVPLFIKYL